MGSTYKHAHVYIQLKIFRLSIVTHDRGFRPIVASDDKPKVIGLLLQRTVHVSILLSNSLVNFDLLKSVLDEKKRLDLRFRPNDIYSKPACGVNRKTAGLVLRVRRRKRQPSCGLPATCVSQGDNDTEAAQNDGYEYKVDVLGTVTTAIKFEGIV